MKTKNCKVRIKDVKAGVTIYISHPVYGIDKVFITGAPKLHRTIGSLFAEGSFSGSAYTREFSLRDAGIYPGNSYNWRRSFFKMKQAIDWSERMKTSPEFLISQKRHEEDCKKLDLLLGGFYV